MTAVRFLHVPPALAAAHAAAHAGWQRDTRTARLWGRDATLWTGADEARWLGWLDAPRLERSRLARYTDFAADLRARGIARVLWAGIGGSSLAARVYAGFAPPQAEVALTVLDTLMPEDLAPVVADARSALAVVASKSGTTLEVQRLADWLSSLIPAGRFAAVTDAGSPLERQARERGYAAVFEGDRCVGGRYSALTAFGLLAASLAGFDADRLLARADAMAAQCRREDMSNPGLALGLLLGCAARTGRDKLALVASPRLHTFARWIEQLIAESTGKSGTGIVPVVIPPGIDPPAVRADRLVIRLAMRGDPEPAVSGATPVVDFVLDEAHDLGAEFFRWMFATAVAGSALGVNPFDQPDVESAKAAARRYLDAPASDTTPAPQSVPVALVSASGIGEAGADPARAVAMLLSSLGGGDHLAVLCWLPEALAPNVARLQARLANSTGVAISTGFGPRYLHSAGQLHKGGPAQTACLILSVARKKIATEWQPFVDALEAQARADAQTLAARGRRVVWLRLAEPLDAALDALARA